MNEYDYTQRDMSYPERDGLTQTRDINTHTHTHTYTDHLIRIAQQNLIYSTRL